MTLLLNALRLAVSAIGRNKTRAALTVLGILIGITAVVMIVALADSVSGQVSGQIDSFAAAGIFVHPQPVQASGARAKTLGRLTEADGLAIKREAVSVAGVAFWLNTQGQVVAGDKNYSTQIIGSNRDYLDIRKYKIGKGEMWSENDEAFKTKVCVIGHTVTLQLFGDVDPVGRTVRIGRSPYRIIGEFTPKGNSPFGDDQDDRIMMPIGSYRARIQHTSPGRVDQLIIGATSEQVVERAVSQIDSILRQRHHIQPGAEPDFEVNTQAEMQKATSAITGILSALLIGVAFVSLVVGGIGVMNIMLVSVAERTREIGIRMSIGARAHDILMQFLIEAIVLTMIGGLLGIVVGVGFTFLGSFLLDWSLIPSARAYLIALGTSVFIGIVFGILPSWRAAHLDPVEALRTD